MKILTGKIGETIRIGKDIEIVITGTRQNEARIGFRTPKGIPVYRDEIYQKIKPLKPSRKTIPKRDRNP